MGYKFDTLEFSKRIKTKRVIELSTGLREVAQKVKVSPASISRMERGSVPEMKSFLKMCGWLQSSPQDFFATEKISTKIKGK